MKYLIEFKIASDEESEKEACPQEAEEEGEEEGGEETKGDTSVSISDVKDITDPLTKVEAGLKVEGGEVPLQSVHIRAQLIDLAAKVRIIVK